MTTAAPPCARTACDAPPTSTVVGRCLGCKAEIDQATCTAHVTELTDGMLLGYVRSRCCGQPSTLVRVAPL